MLVVYQNIDINKLLLKIYKKVALSMKFKHRKEIFCNSQNTFRPALFLDLDGVIIEDKHYIKNSWEVDLCEGIKELLCTAFNSGWHIIIVSNQSGISKGILDWNDFQNVNKRMKYLLGNKSLFSAIYANSCTDTDPKPNWRKPSPGMIFDASQSLNIDIQNSILVGDRLSDLLAGLDAGMKYVCHVLSGHGKKEREFINKKFGIMDDGLSEYKCYSKHKIILLNTLKNFPHEIISSKKFSILK